MNSPIKKVTETYTKMLVTLVITIWVISFIVMYIIWFRTGRYSSDIMGNINTVAVPTILAYCTKSGFEFKTRLSANQSGNNYDKSGETADVSDVSAMN